ncbi:MAG: hypothetical protein R3C04_11375, partial [Hyphomonas sp.]
MLRLAAIGAAALLASCAGIPGPAAPAPDAATVSPFEARLADWRIGAVTYQVFMDRYVPSANLDAKRGLYAAPRSLEAWQTLPAHGHKVDGSIHWSH